MSSYMTRSRWLRPSKVLKAKPPSTIVSIARPMKLLSSLARIPRNKTSSVRTGARGDARCSETQVTERHFPTPKPTGAPFRLLRLTLAVSNDTTPEGFSETLKAPSRYRSAGERAVGHYASEEECDDSGFGQDSHCLSGWRQPYGVYCWRARPPPEALPPPPAATR